MAISIAAAFTELDRLSSEAIASVHALCALEEVSSKIAAVFGAGDNGGQQCATPAVPIDGVQSLMRHMFTMLHNKPFDEVPSGWRGVYSLCCIVNARWKCTRGSDVAECAAEAIKDLDLALLLGGGFHRDTLFEMLRVLHQLCGDDAGGEVAGGEGAAGSSRGARKRKRPAADDGPRRPLHGLQTSPVLRLHQPSQASFERALALAVPVVVTGEMDDWPALRRWADLEYIRRRAGRRTVPIEVGKSHLNAGCMQQRLMTMDAFIDECVLLTSPSTVHTATAMALSATVPVTAASNVGYLAQHRLFEQIPELAADIRTPRFIDGAVGHRATPRAGEGKGKQGAGRGAAAGGTARSLIQRPPQSPRRGGSGTGAGQSGKAGAEDATAVSGLITSAWFGGSGTVTPLHFDRHSNFLAQAAGRKLVLLCGARHSAAVYPCSGLRVPASRSGSPEGGVGGGGGGAGGGAGAGAGLEGAGAAESAEEGAEGAGGCDNASRVDVFAPDFGRFPLFRGLAEWANSAHSEHSTAEGGGVGDGGGGSGGDGNATARIEEAAARAAEEGMSEVVLEPGEMLFIPEGHWHVVKSLSVSFSVSFWF